MAGLTLYTRENCPKCLALKQMLDSKHVIYESVDLGIEANLLAFKQAYPLVKSVPFVAGNSIHFHQGM